MDLKGTRPRRYFFVVLLFIISTFTNIDMTNADENLGDYLVAPTLLYYAGSRTRSSQDERSYLVYELRLAYQVSSNIYLGLSYQAEQEKVDTKGYSDPSLNYSNSGARTSLGPTLGYVFNNFHVMFTFFYDSKWSLNSIKSSGTDKYEYEGSGYQIDLGYKIPLWGGFFGPQISYKTFTYPKLKTNNAAAETINPALKENKFDPSITYFFTF